jgi:Na+/H+ antiporter NhaD/arsenite permease-like protein
MFSFPRIPGVVRLLAIAALCCGPAALLIAADKPKRNDRPNHAANITASGAHAAHPGGAGAGARAEAGAGGRTEHRAGHDASHGDGRSTGHNHGHNTGHEQGHHDGHSGGHNLGEKLPMYTVVPFGALLLCIALLPLIAHHWWEQNSSKAVVALTFAAPVVIYWLAVWKSEGMHVLHHAGEEYVTFICLLGALFVISGGVYVQGSLAGTPLVNTAVMAFGASIASFVGTTGASMLLIRPLLRANASRKHRAHIVVFFIFIVSNCGGLLTPLGDPPLFLGFIKGVPFDWTFRLWKEWMFVNGALLVLFNVYDQMVLNREEKERAGSQLEAVQQNEPLRVSGLVNIALLLGVVATVYCYGNGIGNGGKPWSFGVQESILACIAAVSYFTTPKAIHEGNRFTFAPINEVAILFAGIFVTMGPALQILNARGRDLGVSEPWQYFWVTGVLSSFLDNAPTYLTFAATACGMQGVSLEGQYLAEFLKTPGAIDTLAAISCGAVFMGANTYIGNGPNFMVKAIAEENGVKMPGFFGYMVYACCVLMPLFVVVTFVFFR